MCQHDVQLKAQRTLHFTRSIDKFSLDLPKKPCSVQLGVKLRLKIVNLDTGAREIVCAPGWKKSAVRNKIWRKVITFELS